MKTKYLEIIRKPKQEPSKNLESLFGRSELHSSSGAVVSRDVDPYAAMAGNPAQKIRWRFDEPTRIALLASA